jgi:predicted ATPase
LWFDRFQIAEDALLAEAEMKWVERFLELAQAKEDDPSLGVEAAHALGLMLGLPFRASPFIGALRQDSSQVKGRGFAISRALLSRMRETSPTVMLVEDLHWADPSSWHWLVETVLGAPELPQGLFVLATARPEWSPPPELRTRETNGKEGYVEIPLGPLADETVRELAGELLQRVEPMPDDVLNSVVERAEGNPYYAEEIVNYFLDRGIIDPNGEPWQFVQARWQGSPLPTTLQQLLLTRLTALTEPERTALQRGAIFGRSFWTGGLEAMGVRDSIRLLDGLLPRGLVDPQPESVFEAEREWAFHHALLHEVTYESVLKRERAALHRQAAQWLEQQARRAGRVDEFAGTIAEHWDRAGEQNAAIDWYLRAGESAVASFALAEGRRFFDRVLQLLAPADNERRWRALSGREFILDALAQRELQKADIDALLELANTFDNDLWCAHAYHRKAWYHATMADAQSAVAAAEQVSAAAQRARQRHARVASVPGELRALGLKTGALSRLGEMSAAIQTAEEILARANSEESGTTLAGALNFVAIHFQEANDLARSTKVMLQVIQMARNCGDRFNEAMAAGNLGFNYILFGMYKQARATLEQALTLHAAIGNQRLRAYAQQNLGLALCLSGDRLLARQVEEQALNEAIAQRDRFLKASCLYYLGLIIEQSGDPAGAARFFAQAQVEFSEINYRTHTLDPTAGLARCAFAQGLLEEAQQHTAQVWKHLSEHGTTGMEFPTQTYLTVVDIMDGLRDQETARLALEEGYRELMERADKISEPEWRKSFLENVEAHRTMVEMWERHRQAHCTGSGT